MQVASNVTRVNIKITSTKLYFPIAALWKNNDIASLENLKQARIKKKKTSLERNSETSIDLKWQPNQKNKLHYMIE